MYWVECEAPEVASAVYVDTEVLQPGMTGESITGHHSMLSMKPCN
jgi:hypothetical protein